MEQLLFKLPVFEGPMDLLLHLITKHKLDIYDIEISLLLEQYIGYIEELRAADLEVASAFLTMAARLVYMKTASLLPRHEELEELKRELQGQLLEYRICKMIAAELAKENLYGLMIARSPTAFPADKSYRGEHKPTELLFAYRAALGRGKRKLPPPQSAFSDIVARRIVSVESRIVYVLQKLYKHGIVSYDEFFYSGDRSDMVATFLAMLELIKSRRIRISEDNSTVIFCRERDGVTVGN